MYSYYNPHPSKDRIGDCVIRALTKALNKSWEEIYIDLSIEGYIKCDLPNADIVWGKYLIKNGFCRNLIPDDGFGDYTIEDFANDHLMNKIGEAMENADPNEREILKDCMRKLERA